MAYRLAGTYVGHCDCRQLCPCAVDGPPTGRDGQCHGLLVHDVTEGNLDDVNLSGVRVAMEYLSPSNISAGNLKIGIVVDSSASEEQADALAQIFKGDAGGMFGDFAPLFGEWTGVRRADISFSGGDEPSASVGGTDVNFTAFRGGDGGLTTISNAMFGFGPVFTIGQSSGTSEAFGESFEASYGEAAAFEYA
ncbi:DUF1326 domain-containing protein [Aeromicrobium sp.]|uniref:DUF1326 domain-containing protein n=1 Tax=Aeromicrobium sp. TaxID=1871063 RepID=UPI003D6A6943